MEGNHIYSLSDLPPELVELIVSQLNAAGLVKFGRCNKELKQLCNRDCWWQKRIHIEKPSVLLVPTKYKKWKSIYRHCTPIENTGLPSDLANEILHTDKRIIFAPGVHKFTQELTITDHKQLTGLYDIHWSNKTSDQKSVLICRGIKFSSYAHVDSAVVFSNLSIKLEQGSKAQFGLTTNKVKATVTNCEIECGIHIRDKSTVTLKNCHLMGGTVSGVSVMNSSVTIENCRVDKNETGISLLAVGYEDTCQISDSTIINNTRGVNASNVQAKFQLKNNVIEYNKQFGVGTNSSRASLVQNKITNNHTGVFSCEMSLITLEDNMIKKNKYWGVCIQHGSAVGKFTGNQITHNHVIGVQLPESLKRPHLTSEALHASNTFSDNETDLVLSNERVTDQGFIALAPFPMWAPLDSLEVLQTKLKMTVRRKFCTYNMTGTQSVAQEWFTCHTCTPAMKKICATCVKICHKGHQVIPSVTEVQYHSYCECGIGSGCKALWK